METIFVLPFHSLSSSRTKCCTKWFVQFALIILLAVLTRPTRHVESSILIGAIFSNGAPFPNGSMPTIPPESDEEIVFKHAVYISNQNKFGFNGGGGGSSGGGGGGGSSGAASSAIANTYSTLLHKIIQVSPSDQLKTIKKICQETSGNLMALIGPHDESLKMYSRSLAEQLDLIHFDIDAAVEPTYSFNLHPAGDVICQAFADLIRRFEWRHLAIIYNTNTNLKKVKCLLGGPTPLVPKLDITLRIVNFDYEYRLILRDLSRRSVRNIVLDLEPDEAQVVLKMALQLGMINSSYHFILTTLDAETINLEDYKYNRANLTALRLIKSDSAFYKSISLNLTDYNSITSTSPTNNDKNKILLRTKNALMFDTVYAFAAAIKAAERHIPGLEGGNVSCQDDRNLEIGTKLSTFVENVNVVGLTGSISFRDKVRRDFDLDILQLKETGLFKCGYWSSKTGLNFTFYDELFDDDMFNYKKNMFRVVTLVEEPYVMEKEGKLEGFCIDILNEIAHKMNFRYEIYKVPDNQYGNEDANGSWNGMIRELMDKKADLAISAFTINFKRQQVVDFTKPFLNLGISILYKVPRSKKPGLFSFLNPLSLEIWMYTLITYILISLIMMILARFSPYEWRNKHPCNLNNDYVENQFTVWNSLWFAMGTLMQQGSDINPKALSTRLVGGVWWFFTLIIISSYTANLAAFLTVEKFDISITSVEQLANQTKVAYGVFKGGSTMNFFKESKIETYRKMWQYMERNPDIAFVSSNTEGIKRVHERDFAYLMESPLIDYEIQKNCSLTQIGGLLDTKGYGIATQLGSPYTDDISLQILEMQEKGTIQKFYNQWWKAGSTCLQNEKKDTKPDPLKVENVGGIFAVLIGGLVLACIVSFFEFIYYAKQNSKKIHKPLCSQMFDDLRFAIKCGGSAKKVQLSGSTAVPLKKLSSKMKKSASESNNLSRSGGLSNQQQHQQQQQQQHPLSHNHSATLPNNMIARAGSARSVVGGVSVQATPTGGGSGGKLRECKKCKEMVRNELFDNITSENAIVCKHDSSTNLSIHNPGLLIVDQDTAFDAQTSLINSHMMPHSSHMHISHQPVDSAYNSGGICSSSRKNSPKGAPKRGNSHSNMTAAENPEYIIMQNNKSTMLFHRASAAAAANNSNTSATTPNKNSNPSGMPSSSVPSSSSHFMIGSPNHPHHLHHSSGHQHHHNHHPHQLSAATGAGIASSSANNFQEISINRYSGSGAGGPISSSSSTTPNDFNQQQQHPLQHRSNLTGSNSNSELKHRTDGKTYASKSKIINNRYV